MQSLGRVGRPSAAANHAPRLAVSRRRLRRAQASSPGQSWCNRPRQPSRLREDRTPRPQWQAANQITLSLAGGSDAVAAGEGPTPLTLALIRRSRKMLAMATITRSASEWASPWQLKTWCWQTVLFFPVLFLSRGWQSRPRIGKALAFRVHGPRITLRGPASCGNIRLNWEDDYWETMHVNGDLGGTRGQIGGVRG